MTFTLSDEQYKNLCTNSNKLLDKLHKALKDREEYKKQRDELIGDIAKLRDSKIAYVVEFFEWFNTLETFKNWKKKPGKPLDVQLDELADMLAFGLSIANQVGVSSEEIKEAIESSFKDTEFHKMFNFKDKEFAQDAVVSTPQIIFKEFYPDQQAIVIVIDIAYNLYSIDQLIDAYKKKMKRNHERQDGTADAGKGYV
ncbi:dUTP diphosphatase [Staphylococcus aureus]|nr:dUTP diphosphatase [Staphylococcus aureus]MBW0154123.1 dUTP diphosphatase [Staphylococcus aureus]MBW1313114.1 dUTP diphosphatase [Staphylococcus aureus]HEP1288476.1 dUTP diphosphatase [Staphylococcus aureus]